jgi:hypothetical protein
MRAAAGEIDGSGLLVIGATLLHFVEDGLRPSKSCPSKFTGIFNSVAGFEAGGFCSDRCPLAAKIAGKIDKIGKIAIFCNQISVLGCRSFFLTDLTDI